MKAAAYAGDPQLPLLVPFHGFTQAVSGLLSKSIFGRNFLELSGLRDSCHQLGWSLWAPQAPYWTNWSNKFVNSLQDPAQARDIIRQARQETKSYGQLVVAGFSDGTPVAHAMACAMRCPLWAYSGLMPDWIQSDGDYRVAISYDQQDIRAMREGSLEAINRYKGFGNPLYLRQGAMDNHKWDQRLNREVLLWLEQEIVLV